MAKWNRGHYVCGDNEYTCSECGFKEWRTSINHFAYCPGCGSKMEGIEPTITFFNEKKTFPKDMTDLLDYDVIGSAKAHLKESIGLKMIESMKDNVDYNCKYRIEETEENESISISIYARIAEKDLEE